jgi:hypothetical protein
VRICASVRLPDHTGLSYWQIRVELPDSDYGLARVTFPQICGLDGAAFTPFMPLCLGLRLDDPLTRDSLKGVFPGSMMTQFIGAESNRGVIYLGAHDPGAHHKAFVVEPNAAAKQVSLKLDYPPAGAGPGLKRWRLPYEAVVGLLDGDWYDAARIYRDWTLESGPWNSARRLTKGGEIPNKLRETDLWVCESGSAEEVVPKTKKMQAFFRVNTAVHWYNWHQIPFDDQYPEYFPTKDGFAEGVADLKKAGILVMPYINGRLWDPKTESWRKDGAESSAVRAEDGNYHKETYGSGVPLVPMCPHTKLWQDKIAGLVRRLIGECGVSGVYVDQIGIARAYPCYAANHGHPVGGGNFWWRGYRKMLRKCRRSVGPGNFLTTEEACEPWNDLLHAFLMVNTAQRSYTLLPLYSAVYGGRTLQFGFQYFARQDAELGLPWRAKVGRNFLWGGQLGWVGTWILDKDLRKEAEFLRDLAQCRKQVRKSLTHGQMLRPPTVANAPLLEIPSPADAKGKPQRIPAAMASAWKHGTSLAVALVNFTDRPFKARLSLPRSEYQLRPGTAYQVTRVTADGPERLGTERGDPISVEERLPARRGRVLVFAPR